MAVLPRVVVKLRTAVRRLSVETTIEEAADEDHSARWDEMMSRIHARDRELERRLAAAERALNRLNG